MNGINFCKLFFLVQLQISGDNGRDENVKFRVQRKVLCASRMYLQADGS